jgi:hypothetical protein
MKQLGLLVAICMALNVSAQLTKKVKKVSYGKGTLYGYWGYNRCAFTKSDIRFRGQGYDFTLRNSVAKDNPSHKFSEYIDLGNITVPQFNTRIGYYFKNHYAISFGYDHMKYIFQDKNQVLLDGRIDQGVDTVWNEGTYVNKPVVTDRNHFHYENSNGLNYLHVELTRSDMLYRTNNSKFAISTNFSLGAGGILSFNDFNFGQQKDMVTISMSGYSLSAHAGLRFEFFNHVFLQAEGSGGFMNQVRVHTRPNDPTAYASQKYGFVMGHIVAGFFLYLKPTNNCDDCPKW